MKLEILRVQNGAVLRVELEGEDSGEEIVYQEQEDDEIEAFADFLRHLVDHYGPTTSRHSQAIALHCSRALNPCPYHCRPLPQRRRHKFFIRQRLDVQVDPVEQRPGNPRAVGVHIVRRAAAGAQAVPPEAALAPLCCLSAVLL